MGQHDDDDDGGWAPYIPVAQRQRQARQKVAALNKKGHDCQPVVIEGRAIAKSFWGKAWCDNLESYSDYANRLPRGRSYVRNGSVIDLRVETGTIKALVSGSDIYTVEIGVQPLEATRWNAIIKECSGKIDSLIELLQGRLSKSVMATVTRHGEGLFPRPGQISLRCSCPDGASMCKHIAAVLYGVGARLDNQPALLFKLRHVDPQELTGQIDSLSTMPPSHTPGALDDSNLSALFGIDLDDAPVSTMRPQQPAAPSRKRSSEPGPVAASPSAMPAKPGKAAVAGAKPSSQPTSAGPVKTGKAAAPRQERRKKTITASDLIARGVARHTIQHWIASGVLLRTAQRGVYETTKQTESRILAYVARITGP